MSKAVNPVSSSPVRCVYTDGRCSAVESIGAGATVGSGLLTDAIVMMVMLLSAGVELHVVAKWHFELIRPQRHEEHSCVRTSARIIFHTTLVRSFTNERHLARFRAANHSCPWTAQCAQLPCSLSCERLRARRSATVPGHAAARRRAAPAAEPGGRHCHWPYIAYIGRRF